MFENAFEITSELVEGKFDEAILKEAFESAKAAYAEQVMQRNVKLKEMMEKARPDDQYYYLQQVDSIMIKSLSMLDEEKGNKESSSYIYPALFDQMRLVMADFCNGINIAMNTIATALVEAMIQVDMKNPIQAEEDRPQLTEEEKEKEMINCNPPELPNILKDPYKNPDEKVIEVTFKYRELATAEEKLEAAIADAAKNLESMLNKPVDQKVLDTVKQAVMSYDSIKNYVTEGVASLSEVDTFGVEMNKECKIILEKKESEKLGVDYDHFIQTLIWTIFIMPIPMQKYMEQMMQAQQQMELQRMAQSQAAVAGKSEAPAGKKGPGSLRAVK